MFYCLIAQTFNIFESSDEQLRVASKRERVERLIVKSMTCKFAKGLGTNFVITALLSRWNLIGVH